MDYIITFESAMAIAKKYASRVYNELDSQAIIYLYGSVVNNKAHPRSDIDIAVISKAFTSDVCKNYAIVNLLAFDIDENIDVQAIILEDWIQKTPFTSQLEKQGVLVA